MRRASRLRRRWANGSHRTWRRPRNRIGEIRLYRACSVLLARRGLSLTRDGENSPARRRSSRSPIRKASTQLLSAERRRAFGLPQISCPKEALRSTRGGSRKSPSFDNNSVRPFHQRHKDRRSAELCGPSFQVCFRDPTGPGASPSRKNWNMFGENFRARFAQWRPVHRHDCIRRRLTHQIRSFAREEDLYVVSSFR